MVHEEKKIAKIIEELTMYFFSIGGDTISSVIEKRADEVKVTFRSNYLPEYEQKLEELEKCLKKEKNEGIEDLYWALAGSGDPGESDQLLLLGMMIDRYGLKHFEKENEIELSLYKKKEAEW